MFTPIPQNRGGKGGERIVLLILAVLIAGAIIYYYASSLQKISQLEKQLKDTSALVAGIEQALKGEGIEVKTESGLNGLSELSQPDQGQKEKEFSRETQEVGQDVSGTRISQIRTGDHVTFFRLVFDVGGSEGKAPRAKAALVGGEQKIVLEIYGISQDTDLQLAAIGRPINFADSAVKSLTGKFVSGDKGKIQYEILMTQDAAFRLEGLTNPARIVLDIEK